MKKKELQIIRHPNKTSNFAVIIKTIEQTSKDLRTELHPHNLIKTLRVYYFNPEKRQFKEKAAILLEQIPGHQYELEKQQYNQISTIVNDNKVYFWRRRKGASNGGWEMQLWRYDLTLGEEEK